MVTTERTDLNYGRKDEFMKQDNKTYWDRVNRKATSFVGESMGFGGGIKEEHRDGNVFRLHVHIIPDEPHQYFKLVDQI